MERKLVSLTLVINHILTQRFTFIIKDKNYKNIESNNLSTDLEALTHYSIHSRDEIGNNSCPHPIIHTFDENTNLSLVLNRDSQLRQL